MRYHVLPLMAVIILLSTLGCSGMKPPSNPAELTTPASTPAEVHWTYQTAAISLTLKSHNQLNEYDGFSHALLLCVYQISDISKFSQMAATDSGLTHLYNCKGYDASVKKVRRIFVQPGTKTVLTFARAEGAQHLAVAAAYYDLQKDGATRTWPIPLDTSKTGILWWRSTLYSPGKLDATLILGPHEIQKLGD